MEKNSQDSDAHVFAEAMFEDLQTDIRKDLGEIRTQALMLYPFDPSLKINGAGQPQSYVDNLYRGAYKPMPNVTVVRVDGSRHFIMLDQPKKFDELLEAFLKS